MTALLCCLMISAAVLYGCRKEGRGTSFVPESTAASSETAGSAPETASEESSASQAEEIRYRQASVSFIASAEAPLVKKIGFFDSALVSLERRERDLQYLDGLDADSYRLELGMGWGSSAFGRLVTSGDEGLVYDFSGLDSVLGILNSVGTDVCLSYSYTPFYLQSDKVTKHKDQPSDLEAWQELLTVMSAHFRESGNTVLYHEVWNEPDCNQEFYTGSWEDYLELYRYSALGIQAGDPDAQIGGPSTAFVTSPGNRYIQFLKYVEENELPLDFFSMHTYGSAYLKNIETARKNLEEAGESFRTVPIHVNEFNVTASPWDYGGALDSYSLGSSMLQCFRDLAEENDVEVVNWAQFLESSVDALGVVDEKGWKKAAYFAFEIWSRLPVDRAVYSSDWIPGMAAFDESRAGAVLMSDSGADQNVEISFSDIPFEECGLSVYVISREHSSYEDNGEEELYSAECAEITGASYIWRGVLPANGVLYFEFNASEVSEASSGGTDAEYVRTYHYYTDRGGDSYAYYDRDSGIARLGSGSTGNTLSTVAAELEFTDNNTMLCFSSVFPENMPAGTVCIRVDYQTDEGYCAAVSSEGDSFIPPWGTGETAETYAESLSLTGNIATEFDLSGSAPENWTGRVIVTFSLQNAEAGTVARAEISEK